jgi:hypothetical protein
LFSRRNPVAVAVINCPERIDVTARIGPIRSARDLGSLMSLALDTDNVVNHLQDEKRKTTQVRAYKHITQSMLHVEGSYCIQLRRFLAVLKRTRFVAEHPSLAPFVERIKYITRDKLQMIAELRGTSLDPMMDVSTLGDAGLDPIMHVSTEFIYPSLGGVQSVLSLTSLSNKLSMLHDMFGKEQGLAFDLDFGDNLETRGKIVDSLCVRILETVPCRQLR